MRLMERIRRHGSTGLKIFLAIFVITVFGGLGVGGFFDNMTGGGRPGSSIDTPPVRGLDPSLKEVAMTVNGRPVSNALFYQRVSNYEQMSRSQAEDPMVRLSLYGYAASSFVQEEVILGEAEKLGIKLTSKDFAEEKQRIVDEQGAALGAAAGKGEPGTIFGEAGSVLEKARQRKSIFAQYLERMGLSESQWETDTARQLLQQKVDEKLQADLDKIADEKAKETKALIDEELAKGTVFSELAAKYSTVDSKKFGGDMKEWLGYGLFVDYPDNAKAILTAKKGEMTPWLEVDRGYQRWEIYDVKEPTAEELETKKQETIDQIRKDKADDKYEPTEDEIKLRLMQVKARQIQLDKTDAMGTGQQRQELLEAAKVEINNPYVLAYQALYDTKLQPVSLDYDALVAIAKRSAAADGYNFSKIKAKLENGQPKAAKAEADPSDEADSSAAAADATAAADAAAVAVPEADGASNETPADETAATETTASAEGAEAPAPADAAAPAEPEVADTDPSGPVYALAVGLLEQALEGAAEDRAGFGQAVIGMVYHEWLKNEAELKDQPVNRDEARQEIETRLSRALENDDYNATLRAVRGLNLAWLDKVEEAKEQLAEAEKLAPNKDGGPLEIIKQAYEKLDMQDKVKEITARIDEARKDAMMEQIEQQMRMQQQQEMAGGGATSSIPIEIQ